MSNMPRTQEAMEAEAAKAENFSIATARASIGRLFDAIPRTKRIQHVGELNDLSVTLDMLAGFFLAALEHEDEKDAARLQSVDKVMTHYLATVMAATGDGE